MSPLAAGVNEEEAVRFHLLFDSEWYSNTYLDAPATNQAAASHYLTTGWLRGYDPSPLFQTDWYLTKYPDVRDAGLNPLLHYIRSGRDEGRQFRGAAPVTYSRVALIVRSSPAHTRLDEQQMLWAQGLSDLGYDVDIYLVTSGYGVEGDSPSRAGEMLASLRRNKYAFSIVMGNVPMMGRVLAETRVALWILEEGSGIEAAKILAGISSSLPLPRIATTSMQAGERLRNILGPGAPAVSYSPPVVGPRKQSDLERTYPISFIGSYLDVKDVEDIYEIAQRSATDVADEILECIDIASDDPTFDVADFCKYGLIGDFLSLNRQPVERFSRSVWNIVSRRRRIPVLQSLEPLGLKLFGPLSWGRTLVAYPDLLKLYQRDRPVDHAGEAPAILDRSRINLILPHALSENAFTVGAAQAMAAGALVVTPYREEADFLTFLGPNAPVAMFKSIDELHDICQHYLGNESERRSVAERCQAVIHEKCSIGPRIESILEAINCPKPSLHIGEFKYTNVVIDQ